MWAGNRPLAWHHFDLRRACGVIDRLDRSLERARELIGRGRLRLGRGDLSLWWGRGRLRRAWFREPRNAREREWLHGPIRDGVGCGTPRELPMSKRLQPAVAIVCTMLTACAVASCGGNATIGPGGNVDVSSLPDAGQEGAMDAPDEPNIPDTGIDGHEDGATSPCVYDCWRPTSDSDLDYGVWHPARAWTGDVVLIYGGYYKADGTDVYGQGGAIYDPSNDKWSPMAAGPLWTNANNTVWTGSRLLDLAFTSCRRAPSRWLDSVMRLECLSAKSTTLIPALVPADGVDCARGRTYDGMNCS